MQSNCYIAAALFNGRETYFNVAIAEGLEAKGHRCLLPQRDGFEFAALHGFLAEVLPERQVPGAVQQIIYHLDLGVFLAQSDVVVALLDEPIDEGVVVEIAYARLAGLPVVGLRTDVRSPYGEFADPCGGAHFFPVLQCDCYVHAAMPNAHGPQATADLQRLVDELDVAIGGLDRGPMTRPPARFAQLIERAERLFGDLEDLHAEHSLRTLAERYLDQRDAILAAAPRKISIPPA